MMNVAKWMNKAWVSFNTNYWATPSLFLFGAILLFYGSYTLDLYLMNHLNLAGILHFRNVESARSVLSMIGTSMMTVACVSFSMTLLAVSHASSQIGPRILSGFLDQKGNQVTLGILIACFTYNLLALVILRDGENVEQYVHLPPVTFILCCLWGLVAVFSFIYFIHHVPSSIRTTQAVARVGSKTIECIKNFYHHDFISSKSLVFSKHTKFFFIDSSESGYVQLIQYRELAEMLAENDLYLEMKCSLGAFVTKKDSLACVYQNSTAAENFDEITKKIKSFIVIGQERSMIQDYRFGFDLLLEIGARALSPGINDPFTFNECVDQLKLSYRTLKEKYSDSLVIQDEQAEARILHALGNLKTFKDNLTRTLHYYAKDDPIASSYLSKSLDTWEY